MSIRICSIVIVAASMVVAGPVTAQKKVVQPSGPDSTSLIDDTRITGLSKKTADEHTPLFNGKNLDGWTFVLDDRRPRWKTCGRCVKGASYIARAGRGDTSARSKTNSRTTSSRWSGAAAGHQRGQQRRIGSHHRPRSAWHLARSHEIQLNNGHAGDIWVIGTTIKIPDPEGRIHDRRHLNLTDKSEKTSSANGTSCGSSATATS